MQFLNYIKNKIILTKKLDEKLLNKIICDLKQEVNAYHAQGNYMPKSTRPEHKRQKIGDTYWSAFSFTEKDIKLLKENNVSDKISV
ncbi:MAG: hypothetical protein LBE13_14360, partial [Bacteroidales bacterium]|nr:hypothetical protein [Bacteroidales bacterium]